VTFRNGFIELAKNMVSEKTIAELIQFIPNELLNSDLNYDQLSDQVRYKLGVPFTHKRQPFAYGTPQMPVLSIFVKAFVIAYEVLDKNDFLLFCRNLFIPSKHADALFEMRPLISSINIKNIEYEVPGGKNKKIDWRLCYDNYQILVDVKNRTGNTYEHLVNIVNRNSPSMIPETKPETFFKSTYEKFNINNVENIYQGVWIHIGIKEYAISLSTYFHMNIDPLLLQFFIISGWKNECYICTRNEKQKQILLSTFNLVITDDYVFYIPLSYDGV
jgi:hypothetical protein